MSTSELQKAFQEWHRLARAEGEAIRTGNWPMLADCQKALLELQPRIARCVEDARQEGARPGTDSHANDGIRALVAELIEIENQNNALLNTMRGELQSRLSQLDRSGHTLKQIQRSYAPARPSVWSSFS